MICTFFGHKDSPDSIEATVRFFIEDLILNKSVNIFYVGNNGKFDNMVNCILKELSQKYPIKHWIVLAYMPSSKQEITEENNTILPEGIECVPKRFAISWRNKWMINKSDYVVTYVTRSIGSSVKFKQMAEKQNKTVIEINNIRE